MILNNSITVYGSSETKDANGAFVVAYSTSLGTELANVQPFGASEIEIQIWGIVDRASNLKRCFTKVGTNIALGRQVLYDGVRYDIVNVKVWMNHVASILVPVQGV